MEQVNQVDYEEVYEVLKEAGFTPAKAAEIRLDYSRGDEYAVKWVQMCMKWKKDFQEAKINNS